jgi:hypothetical protein
VGQHPGHNSCKNLQEFSGILACSGCKVHVRILTELGWPISQNSGANCIMAEKKIWNQTRVKNFNHDITNDSFKIVWYLKYISLLNLNSVYHNIFKIYFFPVLEFIWYFQSLQYI